MSVRILLQVFLPWTQAKLHYYCREKLFHAMQFTAVEGMKRFRQAGYTLSYTSPQQHQNVHAAQYCSMFGACIQTDTPNHKSLSQKT
jgi:hypothetical protein